MGLKCWMVAALGYNNFMSDIDSLFEETFIKESIADFIRKVYVLLEVPFRAIQGRRYEDVIGWDTDNRTIAIRDP